MNTAFNRHTFPNGGWQFFQPQTKWRNPMPLGYTFEQTVEAIIKHRLMNKAITAKHKLATDFNEVATELEIFTKKRLGIALGDTTSPKPIAPQASLAGRVAAVGAAIKKVSVGVGTVIDCVQGQPVAREVAEERARICTAGMPDGKPCPMNGEGDFTRWFTVPLSEAIRQAESRLKEQKLETSRDAWLKVCDACSCPLKLKVHCQLSTLKEHLLPEVQKDLHPICWITK